LGGSTPQSARFIKCSRNNIHNRQICPCMNRTKFVYKISIHSSLLRISQSIPLLCILSKCTFTQSTLIHRFHHHNSCPIFGEIFHFLYSKKSLYLFFIIDFQPTYNCFKGALFSTLQPFTFFKRRNSWNWSCCIKKPLALYN